ncbi:MULTISPECIES: phage tail protein [unclassified Megasphaera]|uniref:phage tail protein n=1 Tax=unclassified Megasphaera TaxID=2626256 RepID=UPI0025BA81A6|nr:phage tail protein [Megasphaera sp. UBA4233]
MGIFRGHTTTIRGNKIADFTVSTAEYGAPVPEILGTTRVSGNVIYYDDFTAHEHRQTQRSGKGGHSKTVTVSYTYTVAAVLGLCEGPVSGIKRVWVGKDIYNYPNDAIQLTLWKGTQDQKPWAYVTGKHPDKALPYTGLAYMAGIIDLGDSGSMPNYNFEVAGKLLDTGDGVDVNPADYIRYVLDKVGLNSVEIIGLDNYRRYCAAADLLISTPPDETQSKSARDIINEIATLTNAYVFWSNDTFKIVPLDDRTYSSWTPNRTVLYNLTADDFIPQSGGALVTYQRKDSSEVYNQYPVEFINRTNGYEKETVSYAVTDDIADYGLRQANTTQAHYFYTKERAVKLAESLARNGKYGRNKYTFKLDWSFCRLEVGDLVTLTDENCGLNKQVVLIDSVTEGTDGLLTFTAVSRPDGQYSEAIYDVHETDRPYINYNQPAPDTDKPVILQPPADLTTNGLELWIGAKGTADMWGGCDVFVSDDNAHYRLAGQITNTARIGTLAATISKDTTTIEVSVNGTFLSGTEQDAERGNTLCWLDGECLSYQTATLLSNGHYQLTDCIRAQYNTSATSHAAGASFARLDATLLHIPFHKEDVGKKIWLKFASYNIFGSGNQSLAEVKAYEYTIMAYYIPPVSDLTAYNRYRQMPDGVARYDLVVTWTPPDLQSYLSGEVWYKTNHQQAQSIVIKEGTSADAMGFDGEWIYGGSGKNQVVIPQAVVGDTYRICVCTKDEWGISTSPDIAPSVDILVAMKTTTPNVPDNFSIAFSGTAIVTWNEVTNTDIAYYEIRNDAYPGAETAGLLARTNGVSATIPLTSRQGKLYLYARNALGKYSDAAILKYNKGLPPTPNAPVLTASIGGFGVQAEAIPAGCAGMNVYINDDANVRTVNNSLSYTCEAGIYDVCVAYYDMFGEGEKSASSRVTVKIEIDGDMIKNESISLAKVDQAIQETIASGGEAGKAVKVITDNLNKEDGYKNYTALTQLNDAINLRVKADDVVNQINISKESILIDGNKVHITGKTTIDNNVITKGMIQAGAVTAEKMSVSELSAITENVGTLKGGEIIGTTLRNDSNTFSVDANGNIVGASIKSGTIDGSNVRINGYSVKAVAFVRGSISDGGTIPLPSGYSESECMWGVWATDSQTIGSCSGRTAIFYKESEKTGKISTFGVVMNGGTLTSVTADGKYTYMDLSRGGSGSYWCMGVKQY